MERQCQNSSNQSKTQHLQVLDLKFKLFSVQMLLLNFTTHGAFQHSAVLQCTMELIFLLLFLIKGCLEICYLWRHCVQTVNQLKVFHIYSRDLMLLFLNLCLKNLPHPVMTSWDDFMYLLLSKSTNTINTKSKLLTLCLKCTDLWIIFGQILHAQPQSQTFSGERETQHSTEHNALHNMTIACTVLAYLHELKAINKALEEITCYASIITSGVGPPYRGRARHRVGGPAPPWKCCSLSLNPCLLHWVRQGITLCTLGSDLGSQGVMPCCQGITLHFQLIKASAGSS